MDTTRAFAILAPVPEIHLLSGLEAIAAQLDADDNDQPAKVAFGSMAFEVFRKVDELRSRDEAVEVLIYALNSSLNQPLNPEVSWRGLYIGHGASRRGKYAGKSIHRPASAANDNPTWAVFWELEALERLKTPIAIGTLRGLKQKSNYKPRFIPEEPMLIEYPS